MSELSHLLECSLLFKGMEREVGPYVIVWLYVIYVLHQRTAQSSTLPRHGTLKTWFGKTLRVQDLEINDTVKYNFALLLNTFTDIKPCILFPQKFPSVWLAQTEGWGGPVISASEVSISIAGTNRRLVWTSD